MLAELLELHAVSRPRIVDCTYGRGAIWGRLPVREHITKADINPDLPNLDLVASWRDLPQHFPPGSLDVLVWDPIHVSDVGKNSKRYGRYVAAQNPVKGESVVHLYPDFLDVARQLVKSKSGIVLVKLCDQVHSGRYQWQVFELVKAAQNAGWTACQPKLLFSPSAAHDPKHRNQYHTRNDVVYWIVLRNGPDCHGPGRRLKHELTCQTCGAKFWARRADAATCGPKCRQQRARNGKST